MVYFSLEKLWLQLSRLSSHAQAHRCTRNGHRPHSTTKGACAQSAPGSAWYRCLTGKGDQGKGWILRAAVLLAVPSVSKKRAASAETRPCNRLPRQALWDSTAGHLGPLFNQMMESSEPKTRKGRGAAEQGSRTAIQAHLRRYERGKNKEAEPPSWARPLSASLVTIAERDRKLPPREFESLSPP
jgi:hypothetical protein